LAYCHTRKLNAAAFFLLSVHSYPQQINTGTIQMHIEHINISAPFELIKVVKVFYCELFGLHEGFRPSFTSRGFWLYEGGNALVHLTECNKKPLGEKPGYLDHIAFQLTGLCRFKDNLEKLNIKYTVDSLPEIGMTQLFFKDPAGTGLEVNFKNEAL